MVGCESCAPKPIWCYRLWPRSFGMKLLLVKIFVVFLIAGPIDKVCAENIAVVLSSDASAYQEALEGFREVLRHRIVSVQTLKENSAGWSNDLKKLRSA